MFVKTTTHNRIVAEKDAEIAGLMKRLRAVELPEKAQAVLKEMHADTGYSAETIASHTDVPVKQVRTIIRSFEAYGWAFRHPFFSEDDTFIRGSGYTLTNAGWDVRQALIKDTVA